MKRAEIRECVFKLLFCNEFHNKEDMPEQYRLFLDNIQEAGEEDSAYISSKVTEIAKQIEDIDKKINEAPAFINGILAKLF